MITLTIDTCDRKGSVGVRIEGRCAGLRLHGDEDYSSWLLPSVESSLAESHKSFRQLDLLAVATGPGSFTGVRVGLCAVKAWAEVYGTRVVGVSRLEALAWHTRGDGLVAATYDAHRGQLFGGLYRRHAEQWDLVEAEMVITPEEFFAFVKSQAKGETVQWVSLDPSQIKSLADWKSQLATGTSLITAEVGVANLIGELAEAKAARGEFTDVLQLDANYVRRSDAEIYWKGPAHHAG